MTARRHHPSCAAADGGNCTNCPQWPPMPVGRPVHRSDITCDECGETYKVGGTTPEARERALAAWPGCPCAPETASEATAFKVDAPEVPTARKGARDLFRGPVSFSNAPFLANPTGSSLAPDDVVSSESRSERSVHRRPPLASSDVPRGRDGARAGEVLRVPPVPPRFILSEDQVAGALAEIDRLAAEWTIGRRVVPASIIGPGRVPGSWSLPVERPPRPGPVSRFLRYLAAWPFTADEFTA